MPAASGADEEGTIVDLILNLAFNVGTVLLLSIVAALWIFGVLWLWKIISDVIGAARRNLTQKPSIKEESILENLLDAYRAELADPENMTIVQMKAELLDVSHYADKRSPGAQISRAELQSILERVRNLNRSVCIQKQ
jgi:hypothetical protein